MFPLQLSPRGIIIYILLGLYLSSHTVVSQGDTHKSGDAENESPSETTISETSTEEGLTTTTTTPNIKIKYDNTIFISDGGRQGIYALSLDTGNQTLVEGTHNSDFLPVALAYNAEEEELFCSDHGSSQATIVKFNLDTGERQDRNLSAASTSLLTGFAFDTFSKLLYFTNERHKSISVMTTDFRYHRYILENLHSPRGISLHPTRGLLFWTGRGTGSYIGRASMAGTAVSNIISRRIRQPSALCVDIIEDRLYWYDSGMGKIEKCDLGGRNRVVILRTREFLYDITLDEKYLYASSWVLDRQDYFPLRRIQKTGGTRLEDVGLSYQSYHQYSLVLHNSTYSQQIKEYSGDSHPCLGENMCKMRGIPFCLPINNTSAGCFCAQGYQLNTQLQQCQPDYTVSLEGHGNPRSGRVLVDYRGQTGTICTRVYNGILEARVICRMLGFDTSTPALTVAPLRPNMTEVERVWLDLLLCTGDEADIGSCTHSPWGITHPECGGNSDLHVSCDSDEVRLVDGLVSFQGRIELTLGGKRGTVCDDYFSLKEALVFCRMLKYIGPASDVSIHFYGPGSGAILLDDLQCDGTEEHILQCKHAGVGKHNCDHGEDVGIHCGRLALEVRLEDGPTPNNGRVKLSVGGVEGTVCNNRLSIQQATVYCRMLNYTGSDVSIQSYDAGRGRIMLERVVCSGRETSIDQCLHDGWGYLYADCPHDLDIGINCGPPHRLIVELVDGPDYLHGRVQITNWGLTGTVCQDGFTVQDARVFCRMIGYNESSGISVSHEYRTGPGETYIWLDEVACEGDEEDITLCGHNGWGFHDCEHAQDVGLDCGPLLTPKVYFEGGARVGEPYGSIIISDGKVNESLCYLTVSFETAEVICRMAGYTGPHISLQNYTSTQYPMAKYRFSCVGTEQTLLECKRERLVYCDTVPYPAGVNCGPIEDVSVRLVGGLTQYSGRIEVQYQGQAMSMCLAYFNSAAAKVVCRLVGYRGPTRIITTRLFGAGIGPIIETLQCRGNETRLQDCSNILWNYNFSLCPSHAYDIGIHCGKAPVPARMRMRLEGGMYAYSGRVIIRVNGQDGTICERSNQFGTTQYNTARSICNMLGYKGSDVEAWKIGRGSLDAGTPHWLDGPVCLGNEPLPRCSHLGWGVRRRLQVCDHQHDLAVNCGTISDNATTVSLVQGWGFYHGHVEVSYQGIVGPMCRRATTLTEARLICRMKGYNGSDVSLSTVYSPLQKPALLDSVKCTEADTHIRQCEHRGWGVTLEDCAGVGQVGINCGPISTPPDMFVGLVGDRSNSSGLVQVVVVATGYNGTVCDTRHMASTQTNVAMVICRSLGYKDVEADVWRCQAESQYLLRDVNCTGAEENISQCSFTRDLISRSELCNYTTNLCISCRKTKGDIKLTAHGDVDNTRGRVNISYHNSLNGTLCAKAFGLNEVKVVCSMLGYRGADVAMVDYGAGEGRRVVVDGLSCTGNEHTLADCNYTRFSSYDESPCTPSDVVGVRCGPLGGTTVILPGAGYLPICSIDASENCGTRVVQKIAGGDVANAGSWPWQVSIQSPQNINICGGTIIAPKWIQTAAHCFRVVRSKESAKQFFKVVIGLFDAFRGPGMEFRISNIIHHPLYTTSDTIYNTSNPYDIALVKLDRRITFTSLVSPVCLGAVTSTIPTGPCYATGWGRFHTGFHAPFYLREVLLPVALDRNCETAYPGLFSRRTHLCAGYGRGSTRDVCSGDSGGPLVCRRSDDEVFDLYGSVIGGYLCGIQNRPIYAIFLDIGIFNKWIEYIVLNN